MWLGTTTSAVCSLVEIVRACFDKQMAVLSARHGVGACLQGGRGARMLSAGRETHVWAAGAGRSSWYAFGMAGLESCGFLF